MVCHLCQAENAKKFGAYCGKNPTMSIVNAAEAVLGK